MFQILTHGSKIHQEITVKLKCVLTQGDRQEISMLVFRCDMNAYNIPIKKQLSHQMMVTHVDMLRIRVRHGVLCQLYCTLVVLKNFHAWYTTSRQNKTSHMPHKKSLFGTLRHMATCSASVVESVTHFCVLENQLTAAPPHITTPPDTDLRSVALLA